MIHFVELFLCKVVQSTYYKNRLISYSTPLMIGLEKYPKELFVLLLLFLSDSFFDVLRSLLNEIMIYVKNEFPLEIGSK